MNAHQMSFLKFMQKEFKQNKFYRSLFMNEKIVSRILPTKKSVEKNVVKINSDGVHTPDKKGNRYYRGRLQTRLHMTELYFDQARSFWSKQTLNGQPMKLVEVQVIAAANNTIPYNSPLQQRTLPQVVERDESNRVGWYNVKFENGETGWICNMLYCSVASASQCVAVDTIYQLYNDKKVIACVRSIMEKQK